MLPDDLNVVLASASPRRQELLKLICADFAVIPTNVDETIPDQIEIYDIPIYLAAKKARALDLKNQLVITCDTVVIHNDKILGKPKSEEEAYCMLKSLSGDTHCVVTGVCLSHKGKTATFSETTEVNFYPLTDEEISAYILSGEPFDKAGGYGIQGLGGLFVKSINGDFYTVVGLPIARLRHEIERFVKMAENPHT